MNGGVSHHIHNRLRSVLVVMAMVVVVSLSAAPATAQESTAEPTPPPVETTTPTTTPTPSASPTPSATPVLQTVVVPETVVVTAVVTALATMPAIPTIPAPVFILPPPPPPAIAIPTAPPAPLPPQVVIPPATATHAYGWTRHESIELIPVTGQWALIRDRHASDGAYHESASANAILRFPFTGDGLRVIYRAHPQGGRFAVIVDRITQAVYDTQADEAGFFFAGPFFFDSGYHVVDIVALADQSGGSSIAIDAIDVFSGPPMPASPTSTPVAAPDSSDARRDVARISQIAQPPPIQPTTTPIPEALVTVEVVIAYDLNRNRSPDPNEGVQGMSVRLLDGGDNRLLASGLTDERGYVRLQALTTSAVTAVVPFLGETFTVRAGRGRPQSARWTLLLDAGNQPGLIP